jgi:uncharacterized protein DUF2795
MDTQRAAEIQAVLEGIPLPATRAKLVEYARNQSPTLAQELNGLPDEEFRRLDEVGELLTLVPSAPKPADDLPRPESGKPPGGPDYLTPHPSDTGKVRHDAPRDNPPQKAIEQASQTQKKQKAEQGA